MQEPLRKTLLVSLVALSLVVATISPVIAGSTIISPAGLGPRYTGYTGAGVGLAEKTPNYGIKAGDFVIQPRFLAEMAYNTNFYRASLQSEGLASSTQEGTFLIHLRPGVGIFNPKFTNIAVDLSFDADVMLPIDTTDNEVDAFDQFNVGGVARASIAFFPKGTLTFKIDERFQRQLWRRSSDASGSNANRNNNSLGADVSFHPGGQAIDVTAGYRWGITFYDNLPELDRMSHDIRLMASWRFYPLTHAFIESSVKISEYTAIPNSASEANGNYRNGMPFRVYLGISGYITDRVALLARLGYGNAFLEGRDTQDNFESVIGMAQVTFRFSEMSALTIGGARDYDLTAFGGFRWYGRAYLSFAQRLGDIALLHIDGAFDFRQYGAWAPYEASSGETPTVSDPERSDMRIQAGLLVDFDVLRWFGVSVGYRLDMVLADYTVSNSDGIRGFDYDQHRVYLSLNLRY